jgi:hypothetical protein
MTTKSGIHFSGGWSHDLRVHEVELPNGRKIERLSMEGADEFVEAVGTDFMSTNLNTTNDQELQCAYMIMRIVISNASPEKIAGGFPESELRTFVQHTLDTLATLSTDRTWLCLGTVSICHELLMQVIACFSRHPSFVKMFFSSEGMKAVAKLYASRKQKNDAPNNCVAQLILILVSRSLFILEQDGLASEKVLETMEKAGLLGQFIRCVPVDAEYSSDVVACLQTSCLQLVKKKLKPGTPTGDILDAVISGKDGPINEKAKSGLARLQTLAVLANCDDEKKNGIYMCRHCEKVETQNDSAVLKACQRCKVTYYCNRECQAADWKNHKKWCKALGNRNESSSA